MPGAADSVQHVRRVQPVLLLVLRDDDRPPSRAGSGRGDGRSGSPAASFSGVVRRRGSPVVLWRKALWSGPQIGVRRRRGQVTRGSVAAARVPAAWLRSRPSGPMRPPGGSSRCRPPLAYRWWRRPRACRESCPWRTVDPGSVGTFSAKGTLRRVSASRTFIGARTQCSQVALLATQYSFELLFSSSEKNVKHSGGKPWNPLIVLLAAGDCSPSRSPCRGIRPPQRSRSPARRRWRPPVLRR